MYAELTAILANLNWFLVEIYTGSKKNLKESNSKSLTYII